jgi:hypothetical protein
MTHINYHYGGAGAAAAAALPEVLGAVKPVLETLTPAISTLVGKDGALNTALAEKGAVTEATRQLSSFGKETVSQLGTFATTAVAKDGAVSKVADAVNTVVSDKSVLGVAAKELSAFGQKAVDTTGSTITSATTSLEKTTRDLFGTSRDVIIAVVIGLVFFFLGVPITMAICCVCCCARKDEGFKNKKNKTNKINKVDKNIHKVRNNKINNYVDKSYDNFMNNL